MNVSLLCQTSDKSPYGNDEPWELPQGWVWTTLGEIGKWQAGGTPSRSNKAYFNGNIPWLKTGDLNDGYITHIPEHITQEAVDNSSAKLNPEGSVLIAMYGATIGKVGILTFPATTNQACCACIEYQKAIEQKYLFYFLIASKQDFIMRAGGGAQPNISKDIIVQTPIALPPLNEQQRIVDEVEKFHALVDVVEQGQEDLSTTISQTKSKILDLAIHGKLVPQDPSDEPAEALLKRINPKWQPSDNPHYPFEIPQGWVWSTYGELYDINKKVNSTDNVDAAFMPMTLLKDGYNNAFDFEKKPWGSIKNGFTHFCEGDIVVAKISPCLENRKSAIISGIPNGIGAGTTEIFSLRNKDSNYPFYNLYTLYVLKSDFFINQCTGTFVGVVGQQRISRTFFSSLPLPVPPVEEQQRIVNTIQNLFAALDAIQSQLKA